MYQGPGGGRTTTGKGRGTGPSRRNLSLGNGGSVSGPSSAEPKYLSGKWIRLISCALGAESVDADKPDAKARPPATQAGRNVEEGRGGGNAWVAGSDAEPQAERTRRREPQRRLSDHGPTGGGERRVR